MHLPNGEVEEDVWHRAGTLFIYNKATKKFIIKENILPERD